MQARNSRASVLPARFEIRRRARSTSGGPDQQRDPCANHQRFGDIVRDEQSGLLKPRRADRETASAIRAALSDPARRRVRRTAAPADPPRALAPRRRAGAVHRTDSRGGRSADSLDAGRPMASSKFADSRASILPAGHRNRRGTRPMFGATSRVRKQARPPESRNRCSRRNCTGSCARGGDAVHQHFAASTGTAARSPSGARWSSRNRCGPAIPMSPRV